MKTAEEFKTQAIAKNITYQYLRDCSICQYPLAYEFFKDPHEVIFDAGCDCVRHMKKYISSWDAVAKHYNIQTDPAIIKNMNDFWGFSNNDA